MIKVKQFYFIMILLLLNCKIYAQIGQGGIPTSVTDSSCSSQINIQRVNFALINNDSLLVLDSLSNPNGSTKSFNFAVPLPANQDINSSGTWETLSDSSKLWRLQLTSKGAFSNFLIFNKFYLPRGAELFAYNEDGTQVLGAFTSKNNKPYGRFSLGPIDGETVILEYHEPQNIDTLPQINISAFIHAFKNVFKDHGSFETSGACNINVRCPQGDGWCNQRRSVALIALLTDDVVNPHFIAFCSGVLLTNEHRDNRP
ncbi:MAG: hypothetical protein IH948_01945, partial [Bacteroidetes bacterium]|nr:hypothetical protein [Bacteroidota bacterium]